MRGSGGGKSKVISRKLLKRMLPTHLKQIFPKLNESNCKLTSPVDKKYNCIGWAAGDITRFWWPDRQLTGYWSEDAPREVSAQAFVKMFETLGYQTCSNSTL